MNVAFYAPLKPPCFPVPSGDRRMARSLIQALKLAGHDVEIASVYRSRDGQGNLTRQARLAELGARLAHRVIRRYKRKDPAARPDLWFTYHLYYKAPDFIGPLVCDALDIPYVVAEASHAPKRAGGEWDIGHRATEAAIARADLIFGLNSANTPCVLPLLSDAGKLVPLSPFIDRHPYLDVDRARCRKDLAQRYGLDPAKPWLLTVAMMRNDAKLRSYKLLGAALRELASPDCQLIVVGDGPARPEVEAALPAEQACYLGEKSAEELPDIYGAADIFVWPSINEAYGMATLEAQIAGLPVVAGRTGGVSDIVQSGNTGLLVEPGDAVAFASAVAQLVSNDDLRSTMSTNAASRSRNLHSVEAAAKTLATELSRLVT